MKNTKKLLGLVLLVIFPFVSNGQDEKPKNTENVKSIEKGNVLINPGLTLGWYNYGYALNAVNILPPVSLNFEYAGTDYFSFGVEADYGRRKYQEFSFLPGGNEYTYTYRGLSIRGSFHYLDLLKDLLSDNLVGFYTNKLDFYLGASYGLVLTNSVQTWVDPFTQQQRESKTFDSDLNFGYMAGFRYYFSNNFGAFLESGRNSLGWAKIGLTLKI